MTRHSSLNGTSSKMNGEAFHDWTLKSSVPQHRVKKQSKDHNS